MADGESKLNRIGQIPLFTFAMATRASSIVFTAQPRGWSLRYRVKTPVQINVPPALAQDLKSAQLETFLDLRDAKAYILGTMVKAGYVLTSYCFEYENEPTMTFVNFAPEEK